MGAVVPLSARQQQLVTEALPLIDKVANIVARRTRVPLDDLRSAGAEAAALASLRFDEALGTPFGGFALLRIKGAMLDVVFKDAGPMRATHRSGSTRSFVRTVSLDDADSELGPVEAHVTELVAAAVLPSVAALEAAGWQRYLVASLTEAVAELAPFDRELAHALYWDAMPLPEAATKLNLSVSTARRRHDQLKAKLWRAMRRRGVEP